MCEAWEWLKEETDFKELSAETSLPCHIFTTSSFIKKAAISKGIWSTGKGFVSSLLQVANEGSSDMRDVKQWNKKKKYIYCWKMNQNIPS